MNEAPLPHKGIPRGPQVPGRPESAQPTPSGASDKEMLGLNCKSFPKLAFPSPQNKGAPRPFPPPARAATSGSGRPGGIVQRAGSAPNLGGGGYTATCPSRSFGARGRGHRRAPRPEKFAPLPGVYSPRHEPCNLWPRTQLTGGSTVTNPGPRRGQRGPSAPEQPRAAPGPPPSPREERALESFGGEWRPEGAAAAAGRGRWRLVAPERRDWGGWAGSGGGGRGRDGGRDGHGQ